MDAVDHSIDSEVMHHTTDCVCSDVLTNERYPVVYKNTTIKYDGNFCSSFCIFLW